MLTFISIQSNCAINTRDVGVTYSRNHIRITTVNRKSVHPRRTVREIKLPLPTDVEPAQDIETPETGCLADRTTALDDQHSRSDYVYVPECTPDGRYQRVQCYKSAGYCWCVNEDTGKNIAGTSVKDRRPDCSVNTTRPMKGCPEPKKLEFLRELREFLRVYTAKNASTGCVTDELRFACKCSIITLERAPQG